MNGCYNLCSSFLYCSKLVCNSRKEVQNLKNVIDDVERRPNAEGDLSDLQIEFVFKSPDHNRDKNIGFQ